MRAGERGGTGTGKASWNTPADQVHRRVVGRRSPRARRDEQQTKTTRVAVILSLFLVLFGVTLLVGGRTVLDPMLHAAAEARAANRVSAIVLRMPDGAFCRHLSFDNKTAELTEGAIERCARLGPGEFKRSLSGFAWGTR